MMVPLAFILGFDFPRPAHTNRERHQRLTSRLAFGLLAQRAATGWAGPCAQVGCRGIPSRTHTLPRMAARCGGRGISNWGSRVATFVGGMADCFVCDGLRKAGVPEEQQHPDPAARPESAVHRGAVEFRRSPRPQHAWQQNGGIRRAGMVSGYPGSTASSDGVSRALAALCPLLKLSKPNYSP